MGCNSCGCGGSCGCGNNWWWIIILILVWLWLTGGNATSISAYLSCGCGYTTVTGWMVNYFGKFLTSAFHAGMDTESVVGEFGAMLSNPGEMTLWTELVVVAGFLICSFGLQNGLERVSKVMMLALLALIVVLAVHSLTLPARRRA